MKYNLTTMWARAKKPRRKTVVLRPIVMPSTMASDLYAAGYSDVIKAWSAAIDPIMAEYERTLSAMTTDSPEQVGATIGAVESDLTSLFVAIRLRLEQWAARIERLHRGKWRGAVMQATGVDINTMIGPADARMTMGAAVEANVGLVRNVSEQTRQRIGQVVFQGLTERKPAREVAAAIRESVAMSRRRALNVASDQTVKLASALNEERRREAGIDTWEWVSSHKVHFRPEHHARNGKRYSDNPADGAPPPNDRPGMLPYCGCTSRAVLSLTGEF